MATQTLEERLATVENEIAQVKRQLTAERPQTAPASWEKIFGIFAESEGFEEATRLGWEYRGAQNMADGEGAP